ncbi:MAG: rlmI [Chlamydiales bacterium]|jgi:23S rRNA (cytosine1962-C5)-methyltransferase|nr:rlmI [Chlamydiales bacterium]
MDGIILKKGKDKPLKQGHLWIFSGAVEAMPDAQDGAIAPVFNASKELLGHAFVSHGSIAGRIISKGSAEPLAALKSALLESIALRLELCKKDTAYRLVNGEADRLPGLIVDFYAGGLVLQIGTRGMDRLKGWLVDCLVEALQPKWIFEKSTSPARAAEGMKPLEAPLFGEVPDAIEILESGLKFYALPKSGQKTGFFLDHRQMRQKVRDLSFQKRVLNCFCYTGAFSIYALAGGASCVTSVDVSQPALDLLDQHIALNDLPKQNESRQADVFDFLRDAPLDYDLVILDPPAFAKKQRDVIQACRAYKEINRMAFKKMPPKSFLLTASCSYHVDAKLFQQVVFQAAVEAGRECRIISRHQMAPDHPVNLLHPEGDYLKSLLLYLS